MPKDIREGIESAYLTLAVEAGSISCSQTRKSNLNLLDLQRSTSVRRCRTPCSVADPAQGETQEDAGFRQAEKIMELFR